MTSLMTSLAGAAFCIFCACAQTVIGQSYAGPNTPPVLHFDRRWKIRDNETVGTKIVTAKPSDGEHEVLVYGLKPGDYLDGSRFFRIDSQTGEVFLNSSLQGHAGAQYYLYLTAKDGEFEAKTEVFVEVLPSAGQPSRISPLGARAHPPLSLSPDHVQGFPLFGRVIPTSWHHKEIYATATPVFERKPIVKVTTEAEMLTSTTATGEVAQEEMPVEDEPLPATSSTSSIAMVPVVAAAAIVPIVVVIIAGFLWQRRKRRLRLRPSSHSVPNSVTTTSSMVGKKMKTLQTTSLDNVIHSEDIRSVPDDELQDKDDQSLDEKGIDNEAVEMDPEHHRWEFPRHRLKIFGILGEGCFGQVWKCEARDVAGFSGTTVVAMKTLKENAGEREKKDLLCELEVMKTLDPHPNVVRLLGCCTDKDPVFVIMEYVPHGRLQSYLRNSRAEHDYGNLHANSRNLTSRDLTSFAYQIARGMEYLSSKGIIHRDLAARNVLVGHHKTCKVADFGFARDVAANNVYERKSEGRLPIRWMAPESLYDNVFSTRTDVWSFGVLLWEIVTLGSTPYPGLAAVDVMKSVRDGYRLEKPDHCRREVYNVMYYCWDKDQRERPSFGELARTLEHLLLDDVDYIELDRFPDHAYYNVTTHSGEKI